MREFSENNLWNNWIAQITCSSCRMIFLAFVFLLSFPSVSQGMSKEGWFLGIGATRVQVGGDFDGTTYVAGGGSMEVMPTLETSTGIKCTGGWQSSGGSIGLAYSNSKHTGNWAGIDLDSRFVSYCIEGKVFVFGAIMNRIQPFLTFGFAYNTLTVEGGSTNGYRTADATFKGWDMLPGAGVEISLHEHVAVDLMGVYRWGSYGHVDGIQSGALPDGIDSDGFTGSLEVKYIF